LKAKSQPLARASNFNHSQKHQTAFKPTTPKTALAIERRTSAVLTSAIAQYIAAQVALNEVNL